MDFYSWVQSGLGADLDNALFPLILAKSKTATSGPRMIPKEQWLVMERQPNEGWVNVSLIDHWSPFPKRMHSCLTTGFLKKFKGF